MQRPVLFHNPRCSKSRQALALLVERGLEPEVVLYLDHPPSRVTLEHILEAMGTEPQAIMRTGEPLFKELQLDAPGVDRERLIAAMLDHPRLIERPLLMTSKGARIGRPPTAILEIL